MIANFRRLPPDHYPWAWSMRLAQFDAGFDDFLADFKDTIHSRARRWQPAERVWWLRNDVIESVELLLVQYDITIQMEDAPAHRQLDRTRAAAELYLLPNAPADVVRVVYRYLAKQRHPDAGGSTQAMQKLNECYSLLAEVSS